MAVPFATPEDVADRWRALSDDETRRAEVLVADASRMVRRRFPDVTARIAAGELDPDDLRMVVAGMVKRAMLGPEAEGVTEQSDTTGPFARTQRFANPLGNLYFSADDIAALDAPQVAGRKAFSLDLGPAAAVPDCRWAR